MSVGASGVDNRENIVTLSPLLRFFPVSGLCLGPKISWMGIFEEDFSENIFGLGMDIGYVGKSTVMPYIITSPHFAFMGSSYSEPYGENSSDQVFFLPFTAGLIIPAGKNLGVQLEVGYSIGFNMSSSQNTTANAFTIGLGICGLGEKVAVSVVNTLNLMTSAF
jgi:hypothetical protein